MASWPVSVWQTSAQQLWCVADRSGAAGCSASVLMLWPLPATRSAAASHYPGAGDAAERLVCLLAVRCLFWSVRGHGWQGALQACCLPAAARPLPARPVPAGAGWRDGRVD